MERLSISSDHCLVERSGTTLIVTLNRPEQRNALSPSMLLSMYRAWRLLDSDAGLYCAILTGTGGTFCAGMDLKQSAEDSPDSEEIRACMAQVPDLHWQAMLKTNRPGKPVILAVEGYALAGGTEIALGTDLRVCAEDAVFGIPESRMGLFPMGGSTLRLPRQIPYIKAAEILLLGGHITAQQALEWSLVNWIAPKGKALEKAMAVANDLSLCAPLSLKAMVRQLRLHSAANDESAGLQGEEVEGWTIMATQDAREGMRAFRERRAPHFVGK